MWITGLVIDDGGCPLSAVRIEASDPCTGRRRAVVSNMRGEVRPAGSPARRAYDYIRSRGFRDPRTKDRCANKLCGHDQRKADAT